MNLFKALSYLRTNGDFFKSSIIFLIQMAMTGCYLKSSIVDHSSQADAILALNVTDITVNENAGTAMVTVSLNRANGQDVTFDWTTANNTATSGSDYTAASGASKTIPAGSTSTTITVNINNDTLDEVDENFYVNISNVSSGVVNIDNLASVAVADDDSPPTINIADASATEGNNVVFTVSLSAASGKDITFAWATSDGTATIANSDYTAGTGTGITISAGSTSSTVTIATIADTTAESDETFTVTLSAITNATGGTLAATGTITNDDVSTLTVVAAYPTNGANWNDHVKSDGTNIYNATDTICVGTERGYDTCINGGTMRKVVLTGVPSCSGLTMTDNLGVFVWTCFVNAGTATFYSTGFQSGKGLRDLLNSNSWKSNSVTLAGSLNGASVSATWWTNTVTPLANNSGGALSGVGTVYTIPANQNTTGYTFSADKISVVTLGSSTLTYTGAAAGTVFNLSNEDFVWLETNNNAANLASCTMYIDGVFTRVHNSSFTSEALGGIEDAIWINNNSWSNKVSDSLFENSLADGIWIGWDWDVSYNTIENVTIRGYKDAVVTSDSGYNTFANIVVNGNRNGFVLRDSGSESTIRNLVAENNTQSGVVVGGDGQHKFFNIVSTNNGDFGILVYSDSNTFNRLKIYNNSEDGVWLDSASSNIFVDLLIANNNDDGWDVWNGDENIVSQLTTANNNNGGINLLNSQRSTFNQIVAVNNGDGVKFSNTASGNGTFSQSVVSNNVNRGLSLTNYSNSSKFTGYLLVGGNITDCETTGGTNPGLDNGTCANNGLSDKVLRSGKSLASSFVGKISINDAVNSSDTIGVATFPVTPLTFDWTNFDFYFRTWGKDGSAFPNTDNKAQWTAGNGRIWDWQFLSTDTVVLNRSGDGNVSNGNFVAGSACPSAVDGNQIATDQQTAPHTYLLNAVEIVDPLATGYSAIGNHNGLCENNEACVYTPNFGVYQGHGSLGTCTFSNGAVTGVTVYGYSSNGR